jgi:hypothetical protein
LTTFVESDQFVNASTKHLKDILEILMADAVEFIVIAKTKYVQFNPEIEGLVDTQEFVRFDLVGYSFETSKIEGETLIFRAGFGNASNMVESEVKVNVERIYQILLGENNPVAINFSEPSDLVEKDRYKLFMKRNKKLFNK